jgi:hypothetical protein
MKVISSPKKRIQLLLCFLTIYQIYISAGGYVNLRFPPSAKSQICISAGGYDFMSLPKGDLATHPGTPSPIAGAENACHVAVISSYTRSTEIYLIPSPPAAVRNILPYGPTVLYLYVLTRFFPASQSKKDRVFSQ